MDTKIIEYRYNGQGDTKVHTIVCSDYAMAILVWDMLKTKEFAITLISPRP